MGSGGHVRSGWWRLLAGHATAYGFQFETCILSGFHGTADGFPDEGGDFDSALFDIQDDGSGGWSFCLRRAIRSLLRACVLG